MKKGAVSTDSALEPQHSCGVREHDAEGRGQPDGDAEQGAQQRQVGDARLLVMACLLISDELSEIPSNEIHLNATNANGLENDIENMLAHTTNDLATRIERIAEMLDPA